MTDPAAPSREPEAPAAPTTDGASTSVEAALGTLGAGPVLLYDGSCGVCNRSVQWILSHEKDHSLRFAALESPLGTTLRELARVDAGVDSMLWIEREGAGVRASIRSSAAVRVARYVGGAWKWLAGLLWIVPKPLRDLGYRGFASVRHLVAPSACFLPSPEERLRFLDQARPAARA